MTCTFTHPRCQAIPATMTQVARPDCALLIVTHDATLATAVTDRQVHLTRTSEPSITPEP